MLTSCSLGESNRITELSQLVIPFEALDHHAQSACRKAARNAHQIDEGRDLHVLPRIGVGPEEHEQSHATRDQKTREHGSRRERPVKEELRQSDRGPAIGNEAYQGCQEDHAHRV